jgi:putative toxin-antitoxin system antitoxin component (TIGR02293 family)
MNAAPLAEVLEELKELRRHGGADNDVLSKAEQRLRVFSVEMASAVGGPGREVLVRLLDISTLATRVFGDAERAEAWLTRPNAALSSQRPLDLVKDELGASVVREMLEQIDHGIFA